MKKDEIHVGDWERILFGVAPVEFLFEVFIRTVVSYVVLLLVLKLMGKRMSGKLTHTEMAVTLMFGAIVSSAMQIPDRGVVESLFILFLVLGLQRLITLWTVRNKKVEQITLGNMSLLVKDGVMFLPDLKKEVISRNQLFRKLRSKNVTHLGEVKRLYMETSGSFTLFKNEKPVPGLTVYPMNDDKLRSELKDIGDKKACCRCGTVVDKSSKSPCPNCQSVEFENAVLVNSKT